MSSSANQIVSFALVYLVRFLLITIQPAVQDNKRLTQSLLLLLECVHHNEGFSEKGAVMIHRYFA